MPTVEEAYDAKYGKKKKRKYKSRTMEIKPEDKGKKAKTMPKTGTPGGKAPKMPLSPKDKKPKKVKETEPGGILGSVKAYVKKIKKSVKERTGSETMYEKHKRRRKK
jgi:hypothetical protein